jgi:hypothetical protein
MAAFVSLGEAVCARCPKMDFHALASRETEVLDRFESSEDPHAMKEP